MSTPSSRHIHKEEPRQFVCEACTRRTRASALHAQTPRRRAYQPPCRSRTKVDAAMMTRCVALSQTVLCPARRRIEIHLHGLAPCCARQCHSAMQLYDSSPRRRGEECTSMHAHAFRLAAHTTSARSSEKGLRQGPAAASSAGRARTAADAGAGACASPRVTSGAQSSACGLARRDVWRVRARRPRRAR